MTPSISGSAAAIARDVRVTIPKLQEKASVGAANKATKKVHTETVRGVSRETKIQAKVLRGSKASAKTGASAKAGRIKHYKYTRARKRARVWCGLRKIPLRRVYNRMRFEGGIAKYGRYVADSMQGRTAADAFGARMKSGHEGIFVRKPGAGRLPIQEVALDIKDLVESVVTRNGRRIGGPEFKREFERDLKRRLKKR